MDKNKKLGIVIIVGIIFIIIILVLKFSVVSLKKVPVTSESCFTFNSEKGEITGINDICAEEVNIPSAIGGAKVTSIGSYAMSKKQMKYLKLPDTITTIGIGAFSNNELESVEIPKSVTTIKPLAFMSNKLKEIKIPESVTTLGFESFNDNQVSGKDSFIYQRSKNGIDDTVLVSYAGKERDKVVLPDQITQIYLYSLADCNIKNIVLNEKLERIESNSLSNNLLTSITIPKNVIIINQDAFSGNVDLKEIIVNGKQDKNSFSNFNTTNMNESIIKYKGEDL